MLHQLDVEPETHVGKKKINDNADKKYKKSYQLEIIKIKILCNIHCPLRIIIQCFHGLMMNCQPEKAQKNATDCNDETGSLPTH